MLEIRSRHDGDEPTATTLTLPFELRQRSRLRATLADGREVGLFLARGTVLRGGDRLRAADGTIVEVHGMRATVLDHGQGERIRCRPLRDRTQLAVGDRVSIDQTRGGWEVVELEEREGAVVIL